MIENLRMKRRGRRYGKQAEWRVSHILTELTCEALPYSPYALPLPAAFSQRSSAMLKFANRIRPGWQATRRHPFFGAPPRPLATMRPAAHDATWQPPPFDVKGAAPIA